MERFYDNNSDDEDAEPFFGENDDDEDDDEIEDAIFVDSTGIVDMMQMELAQTELNQQLLAQAVEIAKQSWFWNFKSATTRINEIEMIYKRLLHITDDEKKEE